MRRYALLFASQDQNISHRVMMRGTKVLLQLESQNQERFFTVRAFLELNGTDLSTFYTMESQVLKLVSNATTQTSILTSSHFLLLSTD